MSEKWPVVSKRKRVESSQLRVESKGEGFAHKAVQRGGNAETRKAIHRAGEQTREEEKQWPVKA